MGPHYIQKKTKKTLPQQKYEKISHVHASGLSIEILGWGGGLKMLQKCVK